MTTLTMVLYTKIVEHEDNLRGDIEVDDDIKSLSQSIAMVGLKQPLVGRFNEDGMFVLTAGHRRLKAISLMGADVRKRRFPQGVPCLDDPDDDAGSDVLTMLAENLHREDLDRVAEGKGYLALIDEWGLKMADIAKRHGKSSAHVSRHVALARLPERLHSYAADDNWTYTLEEWVQLSKRWPSFPEEVQLEILDKFDEEKERGDKDHERWGGNDWYNRNPEYEIPPLVWMAIDTSKLAELRRKAEKALVGAPYAEDKILWPERTKHGYMASSFEMVRAITPEGKEYQFQTKVEDPKELTKAAALLVEFNLNTMTISYTPIKFVKPKAHDDGPPVEETESQKKYRLMREAEESAANERFEFLVKALTEKKSSELLTLVMSTCGLNPFGRGTEMLARVWGIEAGDVADRLAQRKKDDILMLWAVRELAPNHLGFYLNPWGANEEAQITQLNQQRWPEGIETFAGVPDPATEAIDDAIAPLQAIVDEAAAQVASGGDESESDTDEDAA